MSDVPSVSIDEIPADAPLLDVREQDEWDTGHAERAQHLPSTEILERYAEVPEGDVYVVCRTGGRSARVTQWLNQNGFDAVNVAGGMGAWQDAGMPLVGGDGQEPFIK